MDRLLDLCADNQGHASWRPCAAGWRVSVITPRGAIATEAATLEVAARRAYRGAAAELAIRPVQLRPALELVEA